ncbi:MFS general substrate transporter [Rhizodiscina lignyota]|uniref:MFS general substrate transporter n=1 Tax=Rhizodiscina lignyota TaxID=1504668 RepID=A0A9P4M815_9PEZI|nr:MFS general substrate transporter [Rhizodiscina lignyota]
MEHSSNNGFHGEEKDKEILGNSDLRAESLASQERLGEKSVENGAIRKETDSPSSVDSVAVEKDCDPEVQDVRVEGINDNDNDLEAATKVASHVPSVRDLTTIPDGGTMAWLQVVGSFFLFWNSWGIINTFGVYQTYYQEELLSSNSPSSIAWIGSIQAFLLLFVGAFCGPLYDAGYFRQLIMTGTFFLVFGHMMLSLCKEYWQVLLAQAFCTGAGPGFLFVPSVAILSTYFRKKIAFSVGVAAAGSSLGGVIYPIMLHKLIPQVGFGWAVRIIGFTVLATLMVPNTVMKMRARPASKRKAVDWTAFRDLPFMLFTLSSFVGFMGLYMPFFYIESFAISRGITDANLGFYLLSIINSASTFGRVLPNFVADRIGPFNVFIPATLLSGIITLCTIPVNSLGGIVCICVFYGFCSGAFVSVPPTIMVHLTDNRGMIGTRMGMSFGFTSIGMLIGAPVGGAILDSGGYTAVWIWGGVLICSGGMLTTLARIAKYGPNPIKRA